MPELIYLTCNCNNVGRFTAFYHTWNSALFRHIIGKVPYHDHDLAREICQQVWTEIWQGVTKGKYEYITPGLLVYRADSRIKDHHRRTTRVRQFDPDRHDQSTNINFDQQIDLQRSLNEIPEDEATIFRLYSLGFLQEEIAEGQMISPRTVRRKLNLATTHLRERLGADPVADCRIAK